MDQTETPAVESSILADLRQSRSKIGEGAEPIDITIPGYDGQLVVSFRWVSPHQLSATAKSLQKIKEPTEQNIAAAADALVATCDEVKVRINGQVQPLSTNGIPITFSDGDRLSYALGFRAPTMEEGARECCRRVFNNDYALINVALKVTEWLEDTSRRTAGEHLGE